MASIGNLRIQAEADLTPLLRDLDRLDNRLRQLEANAKNTKSAFDGLGTAVNDIARGFNFVRDSVFGAADWVLMAEQLQVSTVSLGALRVATAEAGATVQQMTRWLQHMATVLGEASLSGDKAQAKFKGFTGIASQAGRRLAALGLDGKELAKLPLDEAFRKIAERIDGLGSVTEKMRATFQIFGRDIYGRDGPRLLSIFGAVSHSWTELQQKSKAFGFALDPTTFEGLKQGRAALADFSLMWEGLKIQLGAHIGPLLGGIADRITFMISSMGGIDNVVNKVADGFEEAAHWAAQLFDSFRAEAAGPGAERNRIEHEMEMRSIRRQDKNNPNTQWLEAEKKAAAAGRFQQQLETLAQSQAFATLSEQAQRLGMELRTPVEQLHQMGVELYAMWANGLIDDDEFNRKLHGTFTGLEKASGINQIHFAGAMTAGSSAAVSAINQYQARPSNDPQQRVEAFLKEQTELQRLIRLYAQKTAEALAKIKVEG